MPIMVSRGTQSEARVTRAIASQTSFFSQSVKCQTTQPKLHAVAVQKSIATQISRSCQTSPFDDKLSQQLKKQSNSYGDIAKREISEQDELIFFLNGK
eukprot:UC4_evm1s867